MNENEIIEKLHALLIDHFEVDPEALKPEARLYEDLEIDSIDAVDLVVQLRDITGIRVPADDFKQVTTLKDVTDAIKKLV